MELPLRYRLKIPNAFSEIGIKDRASDEKTAIQISQLQYPFAPILLLARVKSHCHCRNSAKKKHHEPYQPLVFPMNRSSLVIFELAVAFTVCIAGYAQESELQIPQIPGDAQKSVWQNYRAAGDAAWSKHDYVLAEKNYSLALKEAEKFGCEDIDLATTLESLARTYLLKKKFVDAFPLMDHAVRIWDKELGAEHEDRFEQRDNAVRSLNNLGVLCLNYDKNETAERMFDEAIKLDPKYYLPYANRSITRKRLGNTKGADADADAVKSLKSP